MKFRKLSFDSRGGGGSLFFRTLRGVMREEGAKLRYLGLRIYQDCKKPGVNFHE